MKQEAPNEFVRRNRHGAGFLGVGRTILLVLKRHRAVADLQNPAVVDGHAMRVTAKILQHPLRASEGRFAVHDPLDASQRPGEREESNGIPQCCDGAGEQQQALPERLFESFEEEPPEQSRQHPDRQEESGLGREPAGSVRADAAACGDAVDMGMEQQILSPAVQHREEADLCAEVAGIGGNSLQGSGAGGEQDFIDLLFVAQHQIVELFGKGENHVVVFDGQQFSLPAFDPACPRQVLAFRTVPVAAGVVGNPFLVAVAAAVPMASERGGTADFYGMHQPELMERKRQSNPIYEVRGLTAEVVG